MERLCAQEWAAARAHGLASPAATSQRLWRERQRASQLVAAVDEGDEATREDGARTAAMLARMQRMVADAQRHFQNMRPEKALALLAEMDADVAARLEREAQLLPRPCARMVVHLRGVRSLCAALRCSFRLQPCVARGPSNPSSAFLIPHRIPHGSTQDPSTARPRCHLCELMARSVRCAHALLRDAAASIECQCQ